MVFNTDKGPLQVTCSLGVSEYPRDASTREALFQRADAALYEAKNGGRNQTRTAQMRDADAAPKRKPAVSRREASARAPVVRPGGATTTAS
jgi:predicted signal transduction protein with EAL and GGDEF domain